MKVTRHLRDRKIKYIAIELKGKRILGQEHGYKDFIDMSYDKSRKQINDNQDYSLRALNTYEQHVLDIDNEELFRSRYGDEMYDNLVSNCPHYLSRNKRLPHFMVVIDNLPEKHRDRIGVNNDKEQICDVLLGQWAWFKKGEEMINDDKEPVHIDYNLLKKKEPKAEQPKAEQPKAKAETEAEVELNKDGEHRLLTEFKKTAYHKEFFNVSKVEDSRVMLKATKSYHCKVCNRKHVNNNNRMVLFEDNVGYRFLCRSMEKDSDGDDKEGTYTPILYYTKPNKDNGINMFELPPNLVKEMYSASHVSLAKIIHHRYKNKYVYTGKKSPFYYFDKHYWVEIDADIILRQKLDTLSRFYEEQEKYMSDRLNEVITKAWKKRSVNYILKNSDKLNDDHEDDKVEQIMSYANKLDAIGKIKKGLGNNTFRRCVLNELVPLFHDDKFIEKLNDLNRSLMVFENGVYDLKADEFRDGRPEDCMSLSTGYDYTPDTDKKTYKLIMGIFDSIFDDKETRDYMIKLFASHLDGDYLNEDVHIWTGKGRNGKGLLDTLLQHSLGNFYGTMDMSFFTQQSTKSNEVSPELAMMKGKRCVMSTEPETNETIKTGRLKKVTGGDKLSARKLFQDTISFKPQFKINLQANDIPNLNKIDSATVERLKIIPFNFVFKSNPKLPHEKQIDKSLKSKFRDDVSIRQQMMLIMIDYYRRFIATDDFKVPEAMKNKTDEYVDENNPVMLWIKEECIVTDQKQDGIKKSEAIKVYSDYVGHKVSAKSFNSMMQFNNIGEKSIKGVRYWYGIKFKDVDVNEEDDDEL